MNKLERTILVLAIVAPLLVVTLGTRFSGLFGSMTLLAFLSSAAAVFVILRDLYRREFDDPNAKQKWTLWIFGTSGIALIVYVFSTGCSPGRACAVRSERGAL